MYLYPNQTAVSSAVPIGSHTGPANKSMGTENPQEALQTFLAMMASINMANNSNMADVKHYISTGNALPIKHNPYRYSLAERKIIKDKIDKMLREGFIQPNTPLRLYIDPGKITSTSIVYHEFK
ncbi:44751_t:CDS:2 [Gigaspora margarita]|uniref:44751_t:CDS:1 n=1 Tax=Gigaspora margarita TaxID=4874 RepID=A0ABN7V1D1_GIGMA|nr:44751_t:CDS:2 [Gigaspora margarita]